LTDIIEGSQNQYISVYKNNVFLLEGSVSHTDVCISYSIANVANTSANMYVARVVTYDVRFLVVER